MVKLILQISKGLIRDSSTRRTVMFYTVLAALMMLFAGSVLINIRHDEHPLLFLLWWFVCAWLTLLAVLLAIFDLLLIRASVRREKRRLAEEILREATERQSQRHEDAS